MALGPMGQGRQAFPAARGGISARAPQSQLSCQGLCKETALCEHVEVVDQVVLEDEWMAA